MSVKIDLDLQAGEVMSKLETIRAELETLDQEDFDLGLDLDIGDQLDDIGDQLDQIGTDFRKDMDAGVSRLEDIEGIDTSGLQVGTGGDSGGDTGSDSGDGSVPSDGRSWRRVHAIAKDHGYWDNNFKKVSDRIHSEESDALSPSKLLETDDKPSFMQRAHRTSGFGLDGNILRFKKKLSEGTLPPISARGDSLMPEKRSLFKTPDFDYHGDIGFGQGDIDLFKRMKEIGDGDGPSIFKKAIPNMRTWYRMLGAIIPMLGAMIVQAAGVAVAMGGVAIAGASLIGLGLVGHGEDMASSWQNAKAQLSELKTELFEAMQPAAQAFAPISEEFLNWAPSQVEKLSHELKGLTTFDNITFDMFRGFTDFLGKMAQGLIANEGAVKQLSRRFGNLIGQGVLDLFQWLTEQAAANQEMLIQLGAALINLGGALYQVFLLVSRLIIALTPLFEAFAILGKVLNNSVVGAIFIFVTIAALATFTLMKLASAMTFIASGGVTKAIAGALGLQGKSFMYLAGQAWGAFVALSRVKQAMLSIAAIGTFGLAGFAAVSAYQGIKDAQTMKDQMSVSGDSMGSIGSSTGTGAPSVYNGGNTYIDVEGDMDGPAADKIADIHGKEDGITEIRDGKNPGAANMSM